MMGRENGPIDHSNLGVRFQDVDETYGNGRLTGIRSLETLTLSIFYDLITQPSNLTGMH